MLNQYILLTELFINIKKFKNVQILICQKKQTDHATMIYDCSKVNPTEATTVPKDDSPQEKASDGRKRQKEKNERAKRSSDQTKEKNKNKG